MHTHKYTHSRSKALLSKAHTRSCVNTKLQHCRGEYIVSPAKWTPKPLVRRACSLDTVICRHANSSSWLSLGRHRWCMRRDLCACRQQLLAQLRKA